MMIIIMIVFIITIMYPVKRAGGTRNMKVSREQVAAHRERILAAAARLFRVRGFEDVTVSEVMKEAGLTHGAFYGHFPSKEALIAEAIEWVLFPPPDRAGKRIPA